MKASRKRNRTTEHRYVEGQLSAYLDGQLSPREQMAVRQHLSACQECQWNLSTLQQTVEWTRALPRVPPPRVFAVPAPAQAVPAPRRRWGFVPLLQGAAALVALLLVFTLAGDFMLGGLLPSSVPQQAVMLDQAPAALQVTAVVQEMEEEVIVELPASESESALGEAEVERAEEDLSSNDEPQAAAKPAMDATVAPEEEQAQAMAIEPARVKESGVTTEREAAEAPAALPPEAPAMEGAAAAQAERQTTATEAVAAAEVTPLPPTEPPPAVAPTSVAQIPAPAPASQEVPTAILRRIPASPLRLFEVGLAILVIFLGTFAILATMLQRMRR